MDLPETKESLLYGTKRLKTVFPDGSMVSTVCLDWPSEAGELVAALDSLSGTNRHGLKFETMTFGPDSWADLACVRTNSWTEACAHHRAQVEARAQYLAAEQA